MKSAIFAGILLVLTLSACTWETYRNQEGKIQFKQKYPTGTGIYYTEGAASQNTNYHSNRPEQHAILPDEKDK